MAAIKMSSKLSMSMDLEKLHFTLENPSENAISYQTIRVGCKGEEEEKQDEKGRKKGYSFLDIELRRTLRVPSDDVVRCVPPGLGSFPLYLTDTFASTLPPSVKAGGAVLPIYRKFRFSVTFRVNIDSSRS
jgi:hypothetical protein